MKQNKCVIGIIGGIGSGKSTVASYIKEQLKADYIEGDEVGHRLLLEKEIIDRIIAVFGQRILTDGMINRSKLGSIVFADEQALLKLNEIMHPIMFQRIEARIADASNTYVILDAAVMLEAGFDRLTDVMIGIEASYPIRVRRLTDKRHIEQDRAQKMIASQRQDYAQYCDYWFDTTQGIENIKDSLDFMLTKIREATYETLL